MVVSSPVVSSLLTIITAPNQLIAITEPYTVRVMSGVTETISFSALTKSL